MLNKVYDTKFMQVSFITAHEDTQYIFIYYQNNELKFVYGYVFYILFLNDKSYVHHKLFVSGHVCFY